MSVKTNLTKTSKDLFYALCGAMGVNYIDADPGFTQSVMVSITMPDGSVFLMRSIPKHLRDAQQGIIKQLGPREIVSPEEGVGVKYFDG